MGALWEELTQAGRELESARETRNVSDRVPSRDGCTSSSLLATFETKFSNSGERTSTPSDGERESGWSECVVWHGERGEASRNGEGKKEKSPSFGGLSFQDCVTGTTRRVRHGDVAAVRVAFDARSGASVLAVTIKEDTDAFAALGACVRCRVDGAVTANRWALRLRNASTNTPRGMEELRVVWWSYGYRPVAMNAGKHSLRYRRVRIKVIRTTPFFASRRRRLRDPRPRDWGARLG